MRANPSSLQCVTASVPPHSMASRAFRNRFRNTCCSLPELPFTAGSMDVAVQLHFDARLFQLMLDQRQGFLNHPVQIHFHEFGGRGARKIQQRIDDLAGAEGLLGDLVEQLRFLLVAGNLLGQHLRVGGDHRQRRIHFVRHARGQQPDGTQLVGLHQTALQFVAIGDVVEDDQAADLLQVLGYQRRDREIQDVTWAVGFRIAVSMAVAVASSAPLLPGPARQQIYRCCGRRSSPRT